MDLTTLVEQLRRERDQVEKQLSGLNAALTALTGPHNGTANQGTSAATRRKISLAQKARWARRRRDGGSSASAPHRTMSAAARRRIAAAQRRRWAAARAKKAK